MFQKIINEIINNPSEIILKGGNARAIAEKYFAKEDILKQYYESITN
jgi:hypothetical protein